MKNRLPYTEKSGTGVKFSAATDGSGNAYLSKNDGDDILLLKMWKDGHVSIDHSTDAGSTWAGKKVVTNANIKYSINEEPVEVRAGTYVDKIVTFDKPFSAAPYISVGFVTNSTGVDMGNFGYSVHSRSAKGFTVRVYNNGTSVRSPSIQWLAILP